MGLLDKIKNDVKKAGTNKSKFIYFREGTKQRVRFLTDMDDGIEVTFHDSFEKSINVPCQELFGRACSYCDDETLRTRSQYIWSVWNYETKEVQLFMFPVNNCSPIPSLMAMYENYGTLTDRDYVISVTGKQQNKTFSVVPMDKVKFRNDKAKPFSEKTILKMLDKAFPADLSDEDEEADEEDKKPVRSKLKKKSEAEDDEDDDYENEETESEETDYSDKTPQELYKLCKKRKIDVESRKPAKYYIKQLEEADKAEDDWGDDEDESDDEWEDE
jgi:hypothetical protein